MIYTLIINFDNKFVKWFIVISNMVQQIYKSISSSLKSRFEELNSYSKIKSCMFDCASSISSMTSERERGERGEGKGKEKGVGEGEGEGEGGGGGGRGRGRRKGVRKEYKTKQSESILVNGFR